MKSKTTLIKLLVSSLLLTLFLSACFPSSPQATPDPNTQQNAAPTQDIGMIETHAAETVYAQLTLNAIMEQPTETAVPPTATVDTNPVATNTPFVLPTNTAIAQVVPDSNTVYPTYTPYVTETPEDENFRCVILAQTIDYEEVMFPGEEFEAGWTIENRGKAYWSAAGIDIVYVSGTKMHRVESPLDLSQDVPPTGNFSFSISMRAPSSAGTYDAYWTFKGDPGTFCPLYVRIKVQ